MPDFLLEIGCEEIPARMIDAASRELRERVNTLLQRERLEPAGAISHLDTPRRLAVLASGIPASQPDITEQVNGPSAQIAYKDGQPTPAAHAFAKKVGVDVGKLEKVSTPKGEYLAATVTRKGRTAAEILAETLPKEISTLYWPKNMYWRKRGETFVRPVRWLVAMLDEQVVPLELFGIARRQDFSRTPYHQAAAGRDSPLQAQCLRRSPARREGSRCGRARAGDPQSARRRDSHHSRSALARRQAARRHRRQSDRISLRHISAASTPNFSTCRKKCWSR